MRKDIENDYEDRNVRLKKDNDALESQLQEKKLELFKLENNLKNQSMIIDKEKESLLGKIEFLEKSLKQHEEREEKANANKLADDSRRDKEFQLLIEELRHKLSAEEIKNSKLENAKEKTEQALETANVLFESKEKHMMEQREELKKALENERKRFEDNLTKLQEKNSSDKEKIANLQKQAVVTVESKLNAVMQEKEERFRSDLKRLEKENEKLKEEIATQKASMDVANKENDKEGKSLIDKFNDLQENFNKLQIQYEFVLKDRDEKVIVLSQNNEQATGFFRQKIADLEEKIRRVEMEKSYCLLEFEKERVKLSMELEHSEAKREELNETIDRMNRKIELLTRENEKLKNDKNQKRSSSGHKFVLGNSSILQNSRGDTGRNFFMTKERELGSYLNTKDDGPRMEDKNNKFDEEKLQTSNFKSKGEFSTKDFE